MTAALRFADVSVARGGRRVLQDISLACEPGRALALLGPNGAGKSTIGHTALGLVRADAGTVEVDGRPVGAWSPTERAARIAWLPQDAAPTEPLPAWEWVAAARYRFGEGWAAAKAAARRALSDMGAEALAFRSVTTLSGGERQRVALAAMLAQQAKLLVADEPASHLDPAFQEEVYGRLGDFVRRGHGLLVVTHDVNLLGALACPVEVMGVRAGRAQFTRPYPSADLPAALSDLFGVPFTAVNVPGTDRSVVVPVRSARSPGDRRAEAES